MNELIGIKKPQEEEHPIKKQVVPPKEENPVVPPPEPIPVQPEQNPVLNEVKEEVKEQENKPEPIPVPVQPANPVFSLFQSNTVSKEEVLRIEKIEINPEEPTGDFVSQEEYVLFRIYSPYYEIYETLITGEYLESIGLTVEREGMLGGGEQQSSSFPYSLFKAMFNNTFGRFGYLFKPKKESLAEENIKKGDNLLTSVSNFKTEELLKSKEVKQEEQKQQEEEEIQQKQQEEIIKKNTPPYYEIKISKSGPVLSQQEYNEKKQRETDDEILEHDENGKTFQEILLETRQNEIQQTRKQILLSSLDVPLPPDSTGNSVANIVEKIKRLEKKEAQNAKVWFIRQQVDSDYENFQQPTPTYKWIKLDLSIS